jgi:iron only hydrogenase large subunit-like protein
VEPLVVIKPEKCTNCHTCIRICPVKAIRAVEDGVYPILDSERCIGCGACIESCAPNAIAYRSSVGEARDLLKSKAKIAAILSPSISAEFDDITDYRKFVQMLRALGIQYVYEMAFGVDLVAQRYLNLFGDFKGRYYITSCDPVVVNYIEKYHPNLISNLAPFVSPMIAMAKVVNSIHKQKVRLLYIGPDIASKDEALLYEDDGKIDCVLTFPELRHLFTEFDINENTLDFSDFEAPLGFKGSLFPLRNGLIQSADIDENLLTSHVICIEGKKAMIEAIGEFEDNVKVIHRNLHVMYGNSLSGPGISNKGSRLFKEHQVIRYANKRLKNFFRAEWYNDIEKFGQLDYTRKYTANDQRLPAPSQEKINEALRKLGKQPGEASNCNQCGYDSCHDFAVDMAKGIVVPEMCTTYAIRHTKTFNQTLKELNEKLAITRKVLKETEAKVRTEHDSAFQASELTNAMLDKLRAGIVIVDYKLNIVKANDPFCRILGDEAMEVSEVIPGLEGADLKKLLPPEIYNLFTFALTNQGEIDSRDVIHNDRILNLSVFPIIENQIAGGIVRDMQAPEVQKAEVIKRVSEVIDKNLEMVQQIGFLLGEGASDIEKMLNSVINFYAKNK